MGTNRHRSRWRRVSAVLLALVGLWFLASAVMPLVDGFRTRHVEFMNNIPIFVILAAVLLAISIGLLFAARRLWRQPPSSSPTHNHSA